MDNKLQTHHTESRRVDNVTSPRGRVRGNKRINVEITERYKAQRILFKLRNRFNLTELSRIFEVHINYLSCTLNSTKKTSSSENPSYYTPGWVIKKVLTSTLMSVKL